ncbi:MAG: response regulator [Gammaproteobacteria bacterium]|nr:response regulator [Gammaproteobacteria bacterium]
MDNHPRKRLLIVDDDADLRELLQQYLTREGFLADLASDAGEMDALLSTQIYDLMILDLMMPGEGGLSIIRRLNSQMRPAILILSARGQDIDRILGLEMGADDYIAKPFNPRELLARIKAVLRRHPPKLDTQSAHLYSFGPFQINRHTHTISKHGEDIALTESEYNMLIIFIQHPNKLLDRDFLLNKIYGYERNPFDRSIDIRITRLRKKLEDDPGKPRYIRTIWGKGYQFTPDIE